MRNSIETEKEFRKDFQELLNKYKAEIEIDDHYQGYPECGQDIKAVVTIMQEYDSNNDELKQEYTEFELGNFLMYQK